MYYVYKGPRKDRNVCALHEFCDISSILHIKPAVRQIYKCMHELCKFSYLKHTHTNTHAMSPTEP